MMRHFVAVALTVVVLGSGVFAAEHGRGPQQQPMPMMQGGMMGGGMMGAAQMPMMHGGMGPMMAGGKIAAWDGNIYLLREGRLVKLNSKLEVVASVELPKPEMPMMRPDMMHGGMMHGGMMDGHMMGGGMMGAQETWKAPASADEQKNPVHAAPKSISAGKALFQQDCATCHGMNGRQGGPQDLASPQVQHQSDGALFWKIANGRPPMPAFQSMLTAEQGWDLVNYIRSLPEKAKSEQLSQGGMMGGGMMGHGMMGGPMTDRGRMVVLMSEGQLAADSKGVYVLAGGRLTTYNHDLKEVRSKALSELAPKHKKGH